MNIIQILIKSKHVIKIDELACEINVGRTTLINDLKKSEALRSFLCLILNLFI